MDNFPWRKVEGCRISRHPWVREIMYGVECGGMAWRETESGAEGDLEVRRGEI